MKEDEQISTWFLWIKKTVLTVKDNIENPVYLIRYSLFSCPWFAIKLHKIMQSDEECMHDHPWSFVSIILKGGYIEATVPDSYCATMSRYKVELRTRYKWFGPGSILWRPRPWIHRLIIPADKEGNPIPATTIVITFKKVREWGFYTPSGWKVWHQFIRSGRKCE